MVRVCANAFKTNRKMVLLTCNTKIFISLLQKLIDLREMTAGLLITIKNVIYLSDFLQSAPCPVYLIPFTA